MSGRVEYEDRLLLSLPEVAYLLRRPIWWVKRHILAKGLLAPTKRIGRYPGRPALRFDAHEYQQMVLDTPTLMREVPDWLRDLGPTRTV